MASHVASLPALLAVCALLSIVHATATDDIAEDYVRKAREVLVGCAAVKKTELPDSRRELVQDHGGGEDNIVLSLLKAANSPEAAQAQLQEDLDFSWAVKKAAPLVMSMILFVVWLFCCWTGFPCCSCCRRCTKERGTRGMYKLKAFMAFLLLGCLVGIAISFDYAFDGYDQFIAGWDRSHCATAELVNITMSGQASQPHFIGLLPVLDTFQALSAQLDNDSALLVELDQIMASTVSIEDAVTVAAATLDLYSSMMSLSTNVRPETASGGTLMHKCQFCEEIAPVIQQASVELSQGVASSLTTARSEVSAQLSVESRIALQTSLRQAIEPLEQFKVTLIKALGFVLDLYNEAGNSKVAQDLTSKGALKQALMTFLLTSLLLLFCGCCASTLCVVRPRTGERYSTGPNRISCCVWECAFLFVIPAFFVSGLLSAVTVPLSGVCLILDDANSQMVSEIKSGIGANISGDEEAVFLDLVDQCIAPSASSSNPNLLDIVFERNQTSGEKIYMRQRFLGSVRDPIKAKFQEITSTTGTQNLSIGDSAAISSLRHITAGNPVNAMMLPDSVQMAADTTFQKLALDSSVAVGYNTSSRCSDHTVSGGLGGLGNVAVPGMSTFMTGLRSLAESAAAPSGDECLQDLTCASGLTADQLAACEAGKAYVNLKQELLGSQRFRCDLFEAADGTDCDPMHMVTKPGGGWHSDCLRVEAGVKTLVVKPRNCTLEEFTLYILQFDHRIKKTFGRLDSTTQEVMSGITENLWAVVDRHILSVLTEVVEGITCGFLPSLYQEMVDSLCYQGIWGLITISKSMIGASCTVLMLLMVTYVVWRRSVDNVNAEIAWIERWVKMNTTE